MPSNQNPNKLTFDTDQELGSRSIHKRLQVIRSFFHALRRRKLIEENPFEGVRLAAAGIKDRQRFITREEAARVLDACPDHHWPRLFHNLRASRETELVESYPVQVVTSWLGNTPSVAMRHYLMTTDAHFEAAIKCEDADEKAAQNPAQQVHAASRKTSHEKNAKSRKPSFFKQKQEGAASCENAEAPELEGTQRPSSAWGARNRDFEERWVP